MVRVTEEPGGEPGAGARPGISCAIAPIRLSQARLGAGATHEIKMADETAGWRETGAGGWGSRRVGSR